MKTQEILTIIGLSCLGLCLLLCLLKMSMKDKKGQANCDKVCGMLFFAAAVLIGVSQLLKETSEPYGDGQCVPAWISKYKPTVVVPLPGGKSGMKCAVPEGWSAGTMQEGQFVPGDAGISNGTFTGGCNDVTGGWNVSGGTGDCSGGCGECMTPDGVQVVAKYNSPPPAPSPPSPSTPPSTGGGCMSGPTKHLFEDTCGTPPAPSGMCSCRESAAACGAQYEFSNKNYPCQQGTTGNCDKTNCV